MYEAGRPIGAAVETRAISSVDPSSWRSGPLGYFDFAYCGAGVASLTIVWTDSSDIVFSRSSRAFAVCRVVSLYSKKRCICGKESVSNIMLISFR
jgi:hypothetical protein